MTMFTLHYSGKGSMRGSKLCDLRLEGAAQVTKTLKVLHNCPGLCQIAQGFKLFLGFPNGHN